MVKRRFAVVVAAMCLGGFGSVTARAQATTGSMGGMEMAKPAAAPSTSLTLSVDGKATVFTTAELKAMPQTTVKVHNEHTKMDETYSGVPLAICWQGWVCGGQDDAAEDAAELSQESKGPINTGCCIR